MYYAEDIINGKLCWKSHPRGEWIEFTQEQLTKKIIALASENLEFSAIIQDLHQQYNLQMKLEHRLN